MRLVTPSGYYYIRLASVFQGGITVPKNLSTNPIDHVHVRKRGKKWAYSFEKARIGGQRRKEERTGYATKKDALAAGIEA